MKDEPITQDMIDAWRINYGLEKRSPQDAMRWWHDQSNGMAPAGAVAALGMCLIELERLRAALAERGEPVAWMTLDEAGTHSMLFFDRAEALTYCDEGEEPTPLYAAMKEPQ